MDVGISRKKIIKSIRSSKFWTDEEQSRFLSQLAELLREGFSLAEGLHLMQIMMGKRQFDIQTMLVKMERGDPFPDTLRPLGFKDLVTVQLYLSLLHGNFNETMQFCAAEIATRKKQWQQLKKIAAYPCFLLLITFFMLLAIRQFMLPTLQYSLTSSSRVTEALVMYLEYLPQITVVSICGLTLLILLLKKYLRKKTALEKAVYYCQLPVVGRWMQDYYSFFFSREFAYFFLNGQSIHHVLEEMMASHSTALMQDVAKKVDEALRQGQSFPEIIKAMPLFKPEMTWMIYHGEKTSQLGLKLKLFSQECYRQLDTNISKHISLLQPVLFFLIGLFIILIYLILMLPMFDMMKGVF